jgi:hypothetical protein
MRLSKRTGRRPCQGRGARSGLQSMPSAGNDFIPANAQCSPDRRIGYGAKPRHDAGCGSTLQAKVVVRAGDHLKSSAHANT